MWIFDLDNTLHDAMPHIFPHINRAMTDYLKRHLDLDEAGANALRVAYWRRYGATLLGLMRHHGVDPHHFLWHTHQLPKLSSMLVFERGLRGLLKHLPGTKLVFSNAPQHYTRAVLRGLGIDDLFADVLSVEGTRFRPKPAPHGFRALLKKHGMHPAQAVMVEDSAENLRTAKRLGLRTVWISRARKQPPHVDVKIASVLQLRRALPKL